MNFLLRIAGPVLGAVLLATACGGGGGGETAGNDGGIGGTGAPLGTLKFAITDAPACGYDAVNISIERLRVHQSASADDAAAGWQEIVLTPARRLNLLDLRNGVLEELGAVQLPAGRYSQLRLVLAANGGSTPLANAVTPSGGLETALETPSAQQAGLKLNVDLAVPAGQVADFVLDFDACKSVVKRGNSGRYNLKPVMAVLPRLSDAGLRVQGYVAAELVNAQVSVQLDGHPVKATVPDPATGRFVLQPLPPGSYDLVINLPGVPDNVPGPVTNRPTAVLTGVPVVAGTPTQVGTAAQPISVPGTSQRARAGSGTVAPATATVRVLQTLSGGPTVEVAWLPVDDVVGSFDFNLQRAAPVRAAYQAGTAAPAFVADLPVAGQYQVEAVSAGQLLRQPVDALASVPPLNFVFP